MALTVDHGLHPDSAAWAALAGEAAARTGVAWRLLRWEGEKPATGLPAAARQARHRLLADAARQAQACVVLLGHTRDDLDEAALMRRGDAPTLGVMSAWSPSPVWPEGRGVFVMRPLLDARRSALRAFLTGHGQTWIDDPANDDPRYARARARHALADRGAPPEARPPDAGRPVPLQHEFWQVEPDGRVVFSRGDLGAVAGPRRFLSAALLCASGTDQPPRGARLERLAEALAGTAPLTASLAGARITADAHRVQVGREAGERARGGMARLPLVPDRLSVWDGRWLMSADAPGVMVAPVAGRLGQLTRGERGWLKMLPPAARSALPVLVSPTGQVALPRPFGNGPGRAQNLVEDRLAGALGQIQSESALLS